MRSRQNLLLRRQRNIATWQEWPWQSTLCRVRRELSPVVFAYPLAIRLMTNDEVINDTCAIS